MLEHLGPITPGKLCALEAIVAMLDAEDNLKAISNASAAFAGGDDARRYVEDLHATRAKVLRLMDGGDSEAREKAEARVRNRAAIEALQARLAQVEQRWPQGR